MRLKGSSVFSSVVLTEGSMGVPNSVQVLRTGEFNHPSYGFFEITPQTLAEMKANFDARVRGIDVSFDYFHDSDKEASAWVNELELRENNTELWAVVSWTPKAAQKLAERELRYFSPDFAFNWQDPESGQTFSNVLFGGGLTNRPFVKEMKAIVADEKQGEKMNLEQALAKLKEEQAKNVKLSEQNADMEKKNSDMEKKLAAVPPPAPAAPAAPAKSEEGDEVAALKKTIADLQSQLAKAQSDNEVMASEKKKADEAKALAEKETEFNVLLSEGKACVAQKPAFLKGDMKEFVKLSQPLNMRGSGASTSTEVVDGDVSAVLKLAEEKIKANPKLSKGEAISMAKKELKK